MSPDIPTAAAVQFADGSFWSQWPYWAVLIAVNALISVWAVFWTRRSAEAAEIGRLAAVGRHFDETVQQLKRTKATELGIELRNDLLLRLATALGEALLMLPKMSRQLDPVMESPEAMHRISLEVNVCRIAASPATIAATSRFMEAWVRAYLQLWRIRNDPSLEHPAADCPDAMLGAAMQATADIDELLWDAQACIREELKIEGEVEFLKAMNENGKRIRAFMSGIN